MGVDKAADLGTDDGGTHILVLFPAEGLCRRRGLCRAGRQRHRHLPDGILHCEYQFLLVVRLEQIVHRPYRDRLPCIVELIKTGQEQDGAISVCFSDLVRHLQPGETRHFNVQHSHLRRFAGKNFQSLSAVFGFIQTYQISQILLQSPAQHLALDQFILCHQQFALHESVSSFSSGCCVCGSSNRTTVP